METLALPAEPEGMTICNVLAPEADPVAGFKNPIERGGLGSWIRSYRPKSAELSGWLADIYRSTIHMAVHVCTTNGGMGAGSDENGW